MDFKSRIPCVQRSQKKSVSSAYPQLLSTRKLSQGSDTGFSFAVRAFRGSTSCQSSSVSRNTMFSGQKALYSVSSSTRKSTVRPNLFAFTPQQNRVSLNFGTNSAQSARRSSVIGNRRFIKDNRRLNDREYHQQCISKIIEFLTANGYRHPITKAFLKSISSAEVTHCFEFLFSFLDAKWKVTPLDAEIPKLLKLVGYPFQVNKSCLVSAASNNARGQLLGIFEWLIDIVNYSQKLNVTQLLFPSNFDDINPKREVLKLCLSSPCDAEQVKDFNLAMAAEKFGNEKAVDDLLDEQNKLEKEIEAIEEHIDHQEQIPTNLSSIEKEIADYKKYIEDMIAHISINKASLHEITTNLQCKMTEKENLHHQLKATQDEVLQQKFDLNDVKWAKDRQKQVDSVFGVEKQELVDLKNEIRTLKLELKHREDILRKLNVDANSCLTILQDVSTSGVIQPYAEHLVTFFSNCEWKEVSQNLLTLNPESEAAAIQREKFISIIHKLKVLIAEQTAAIQVKGLLTEQQNLHDIELKIEEFTSKIKLQKEDIEKLTVELGTVRKSQANEWASIKQQSYENQKKVVELELKVRRLQDEISDKLKKLKRELENKHIVYKEEEEAALKDFKKQSKACSEKLAVITNIVGVSLTEYSEDSKINKECLVRQSKTLENFVQSRMRKTSKVCKKM